MPAESCHVILSHASTMPRHAMLHQWVYPHDPKVRITKMKWADS